VYTGGGSYPDASSGRQAALSKKATKRDSDVSAQVIRSPTRIPVDWFRIVSVFIGLDLVSWISGLRLGFAAIHDDSDYD
jgi:hypothetical protein